MEDYAPHFRHILLFYFRKGKNARQACEKLREVYDEYALQERQCQRWFSKFRAGDFDLNDAPRSGRPTEVDDDKLKALIESNPSFTTREIAETLDIHHSSVHDHLKKLGYVNKHDIWVPRELKEEHLTIRLNICDMLRKREQRDPFLKRLITGEERWIIYNNVSLKRTWSERDGSPDSPVKEDNVYRKFLLSVWWDYKGVVYFELLPEEHIIDTKSYCHQLDKINESIAQRRPELYKSGGIVFLHDNPRPHTNLETRLKLLSLGWDLLPHPQHSPDLAPSDFHLLRPLQNSLQGITFKSEDDVKKHLQGFFANKNSSFYEEGIMKLPERWNKVIKQKGYHIVD